MSKFYCQFANCEYSTDDRHLVHEHHIVPRSMGGDDKNYNKILLCPNHHSVIFVPGCSTGIHSLRTGQSIIIHGWRMTTGGRMLEYETMDGEVHYSETRSTGHR